MCLTPRELKNRSIILELMKDYPRAECPAGVPYRPLLQAMRPQHHQTLERFEKLLAVDRAPAAKLTGAEVLEYRNLMMKVEGFIHGRSRAAAADKVVEIGDGYVPTVAEVRLVLDKLDACGRGYVQKEVSDLRHALKANKCTCCPAEFVPERAYLVLPRESQTLAEERRRMLPFADQFHRAAFMYPISSVEHRGLEEAMSHLRSMISLGGCGADGTNPTIPYVQIQSPEIRRHLDCVHPASEMATKTFTSYFYARHEPVSDQRFIVEWCKPVAARLAAWMNDIRNYILDEANAMLAPDLNPPLPRIKGVGVFPEDWNVKEIHESKEVLDLNELRSEYRFLMQFAVDHRGEDPLPQPKPKRRPPPPGPRGAARLMPRPLRPKPPRRKKPKDGGARAPRRRPSPGV